MNDLLAWIAWGFACGLTLGGVKAVVKRWL